MGRSDSLLRRRYVLPFLLACVILSCNTATGINSVIGFNTNILLQSGLSDLPRTGATSSSPSATFALTIVGMTLVDRKGRKFLFIVGTSGIIVAHLCAGALFVHTEKNRYDAAPALQAMANGRRAQLPRRRRAASSNWSRRAR